MRRLTALAAILFLGVAIATLATAQTRKPVDDVPEWNIFVYQMMNGLGSIPCFRRFRIMNSSNGGASATPGAAPAKGWERQPPER